LKTASEITGVPHELVVRDIADHRFGIDDWSVTTFPSKLPVSCDLAAMPDIVATEGDHVVAVGQVETGQICAKQAIHWKELGESCVRFYLYVPDEEVEAAQGLISKHNVACAGLRSYHYNGKLEIRAIHLADAACKEDDHPWWVALGGSDHNC
jgi:hypothetical protein